MSTNQKVSLDQLVFKSLYYRYRVFVVPVSTIAVCFLLFWFVVLPQIQNWVALQDTLQTDTQNVQVLQQNVAMLTKLDSVTLDNTLQAATAALPTEKDFNGIITSLQNAAAVSGVSLQDYSFGLGNLSGLDQQGKQSQLPIQMSVVLKSTVVSADAFIHQLKNELPLSDVTAISGNANSSVTLTIIFFYTPLPKIVFNNDVPLPSISRSDQKMLENLSVTSGLQSATIASSSAASGSAH